jgi:adenylate cyclase
MVEDITTSLSRFTELFVIARNSAFAYKGKAIDVRQVGRELGVRYVLEGSVRRAGNRVRITGQLVEASSGNHLWADRFDGDLQEIFDLQDHVTARVANAIAPKVEQAEIRRAGHKPTENLDAYDYFLRGLGPYYTLELEPTEEAFRCFNEAIRLDPNFALAHAYAAACFIERGIRNAMVDPLKEVAECTRLAHRAVELGKDDPTVLCYTGLTLGGVARDLDTGANLVERSLLLNPNGAHGLHCRSWIKNWLGEPEQAIDDGLRAMRLNPIHVGLSRIQLSIAFAHFFAGRYGEASTWAERSIQEQVLPFTLRLLAASLALAGRLEEARSAMARAMQLDPAWRFFQVKWLAFRRLDHLARLEEGLRLAGAVE